MIYVYWYKTSETCWISHGRVNLYENDTILLFPWLLVVAIVISYIIQKTLTIEEWMYYLEQRFLNSRFTINKLLMIKWFVPPVNLPTFCTPLISPNYFTDPAPSPAINVHTSLSLLLNMACAGSVIRALGTIH